MLRSNLAFAMLAMSLSGCAAALTNANDADCRHVLGNDGTPLRFCELGSQITVDTQVPQPPPETAARLIDNPEFLTQMINHMPANPHRLSKFERGPRTCSARTPGYITIRTGDFLKIAAMSLGGASERSFPLMEGDADPPPPDIKTPPILR